MENSDFNKGYESGSESLNSFMIWIMVFSIILFLATQGGLSMKFMFIMVRTMQIILHLPIMRVLFPANTMLFVSVMIPTVGFDVLESFFDWES